MGATSGPLAGIRVADFSVHAAGPFAGLMLAEMGAQVIKIESSARLDITRRTHTMYGKPPSSFEQINANKMSACLNLKEPRCGGAGPESCPGFGFGAGEFSAGCARPPGHRLRAAAASKTRHHPGVPLLQRPERPRKQLCRLRPHVRLPWEVWATSPATPTGRRWSSATGWTTLEACWPPSPPWPPSAPNGGPELGQHVDVSLRDMGSAFIGHTLLDYAMNGREAHRQGNRDDAFAPQGVYQCLGDDAWVSVSVGSQEEWLGLVDAMGRPPWAVDDKFGDAFRRWKHHDELDGLIEEWTAGKTPREVTEKLQSHRVAAFPSLSPDQVMSDPHLLAREAFPTVSHPDKGKQRAVAPPWRFSETPACIDQWTPGPGRAQYGSLPWHPRAFRDRGRRPGESPNRLVG